MTRTYRTLEEIKQANRELGHDFFAPATMRFFDSHIDRTLWCGRYFITAERMDPDQPYQYKVRRAMPDGSIRTIAGPFPTRDAAARTIIEMKRRARRIRRTTP